MPTQSTGTGFKDIAASYDRWYESPEGKYIDAQENELFLRLVKPEKGQTILELGCGTGHNILFFQRLGLKVAGIEPAEAMLGIATARCGAEANLCPGDACALTFPDNSFDIVAIITALEFMPDPEGALKEAFRTSKRVIYLGILNSLSIIGVSRQIKAIFKKSIYREARFYSIGDIKRMVDKVEPGAQIEWGSALFFPWGWHHLFGWLDRRLSFHRNPFGGVLGIKLTKPE
jgi:ubiquinone/menaquinone biosynthesis C-methylase UbiE